jgi:hypothetical protein
VQFYRISGLSVASDIVLPGMIASPSESAHLRALTPRPAVVIIAHRAESLALCDRVLRLQAGRDGDVTSAECGQDRLLTGEIP